MCSGPSAAQFVFLLCYASSSVIASPLTQAVNSLEIETPSIDPASLNLDTSYFDPIDNSIALDSSITKCLSDSTEEFRADDFEGVEEGIIVRRNSRVCVPDSRGSSIPKKTTEEGQLRGSSNQQATDELNNKCDPDHSYLISCGGPEVKDQNNPNVIFRFLSSQKLIYFAVANCKAGKFFEFLFDTRTHINENSGTTNSIEARPPWPTAAKVGQYCCKEFDDFVRPTFRIENSVQL